MDNTSDDPVIASYDVYLTESKIPRYVLQYVDRPANEPYDELHEQKPTVFRLKPQTGLIEVDVPIKTTVNYDVQKGRMYGEALRRGRAARDGGAYGLAGGFSAAGSASAAAARARVKTELEDVEMIDIGSDTRDKRVQTSSLLNVQTLGGRMKEPAGGDPLYMLGAFRGNTLHLSPVSAVVQLRPQLHHLDAAEDVTAKTGPGRAKKDADEDGLPRPAEPEARVVDVKVKSADGDEAVVAGNLELLKRMQEERWETYHWIDAESEDAYINYATYMINDYAEALPQLKSAIDAEDYLDAMSAPRIDPARPEMTGWAMKQNSKRHVALSPDANERL